jgi:release factor glutamine methyltransferase
MSHPSTGDSLLIGAARWIDRRDAEILLANCWGLSRSQLLARCGESVPADVADCFGKAVTKRSEGVPVAYLLRRREFWSMTFEVSPSVLVPRPETELVVQRALALVRLPVAEVADLGTGSGAIAISLSHERPEWMITGTDVSTGALEVARRNGAALAGDRVRWLQGDWYAALARRRFDALLSNPPYIADGDPVLRGDGLRHEPRLALTPGGDGFGAFLTLINGAHRHLKPGGWLVLEHGATQAQILRSLLVARGFTSVTSHRDLAGHERVTEGKLAA